MRLKKLWVKDYKNLKDFAIDFEASDGLTMIIGNNGSGKSNVLELISGIFSDAYKGSTQTKTKTHYELSYEIDNITYKIINNNRGRLYYKNNKQVARERYIETRCLPSNVIALYSGEESRLWTTYYESFYKKYIGDGKLKLTFINKYYWNIALLVLLLSSNNTLDDFISGELKINKDDVQIEFQYNTSQISHIVKNSVDELLIRINPRSYNKTVSSLSELNQMLYFDKRFGEDGVISYEENGKLDSEVFWDFTQAFMAQSNKKITDIKIKFNGISTEQLSEGEKKLILVKAVLEFLADEKTLILMDEPDAHINEGRKHTLYDILGEYTNRHIVLTTHSPTLMNLVSSENSLILIKDNIGHTTLMDYEKINGLRHLTGSKFNAYLEKPILYCEGSTTSLEEKIYPILFPDYHVIPCGGHEEVISNVRLFNRTFAENTNYAIGIIDWDFKIDAQLESYKVDKIYALKVLELENVLMDIILLDKMRVQCFSDAEGLQNVIEHVVETCKNNCEKQATKHTTNHLVSQMKSQLSPENRDFGKFKSNVATICNEEAMTEIYQGRLGLLNTYIENGNYDELYKIFDFNHSIDQYVVKGIVNNYENRIIKLIQQDVAIQKFIIDKYFADIPKI